MVSAGGWLHSCHSLGQCCRPVTGACVGLVTVQLPASSLHTMCLFACQYVSVELGGNPIMQRSRALRPVGAQGVVTCMLHWLVRRLGAGSLSVASVTCTACCGCLAVVVLPVGPQVGRLARVTLAGTQCAAQVAPLFCNLHAVSRLCACLGGAACDNQLHQAATLAAGRDVCMKPTTIINAGTLQLDT